MLTRYRLAIWFHRKRTGHHTYMRSEPAPEYPWRASVLVTCDCDRRWRR